jgi:CheY-like chemotaxis protein
MINPLLEDSRILIVDDQEANIDVLVSLLEMQGYKNIKTTQDPRLVTELYSSFDPDLILLDLSMPFLSGFEVMDQLKKQVPPNSYLPILVLTADVTPQSKQKALSGGASDFLTKPFDLVEISLRIKNLLYTVYLHKQLRNQNQVLENKVKERTLELEQQNIELIAAKNKAEASDKLKSAFINNISHEIRTPLNGILGFGQILADENLTHEERETYSQMLNQSSLRLVNTVTNIMDIALLNSGNQKIFFNQFDLEQAIFEVSSKFILPCKEKGLDLILSPSPVRSRIKLTTDYEIFNKVLFQIIDNAVKFTHKGSITLGFEIQGSNLIFYVKDTDIGISDEKKPLVFDSFIQEDDAITRKYEGNGLGLTIARGFIELLNGKIWFTSEKGKGSEFYFSLPYKNEEEDVKVRKQEGETENKIRTILVAEDDDANFMLLKAILNMPFLNILHAENGLQTIDLALFHPEIELILMDIKMPEVDGFEATSQIKCFRPDLPIIALTAYSNSEDKEMAFKSGCDDFLTKPIRREILLRKLKEFGI